MITFQRITDLTDDCRVEFDYCYTWRIRFKAVNANWVHLKTYRAKALENLELLAYKLLYLNGDASQRDITRYLHGVIYRSNVLTDFSNIIALDANKIVKDIFSGDDIIFPEDIFSYERNEWKNGLSKLLDLTVEDYKEIEKESSDIGKLRVKSLLLREKKRVYGKECSLKVAKEVTMIEIVTAIEQIREIDFDGDLSVAEISRVSGVSEPTVYRYISEMEEVLNTVNESGGLYNSNEALYADKEKNIEEAAKELYNSNKKITQLAIHKITGISRTTIRKHWRSFEILFNELNSKL